MNLKDLSDEALLKATQIAVQRERDALLVVLHHLREVGRRRLFCTLQYSSLFEYAVKALGYSESQAYDRISAMRAFNELPEIEEKIESGAMTLTNLCLAQTFFRQENKSRPVSREEKVEVLEQLENLTKREAEKMVASLATNPLPIKRERTRAISENQIELKIVISSDLDVKLSRLKGLLAHSLPGLSTADLLDKLCELGLDKWDPARKKTKTEFGPEQKSRVIRGSLKKFIWTNANGRCENCGSQHALEIDHRRPVAKGGRSSPENLRLLCRSCNQRAAIEEFGLEKMSEHLP